MRFRRKRTNDTARKIDELDERWRIDVRRSDAVMDDESIPIEQRVAMAHAILLGPTRYAGMTRSGMRTDPDCPPHLRAIRRPSGGYFG